MICVFMLVLGPESFRCQLEFQHDGRCRHDLEDVDATVSWTPTPEHRELACALNGVRRSSESPKG